MAEKFLILGRAGSGKTAFVLDKFYRYIETSSTEKAIFLLPTHSQVEHLKDVIIRKGPARGFVDNSLFTFSRLAQEVLDKRLPGRVISELEKEAILKGLLERHPPKFLGDSWGYQGLRFALLRFIKELKEDSLYPSEFRTKTDLLVSKGRLNTPAVREKYQALVETYSRFQGALESEKFCDEDDILNAALKRLKGDASLLREKEMLVVDGFHSFTPVEFRLLKILVQKIPNIYVSLVLDLKSPDAPIFQRCREVYEQLNPLGLFEEISLTDSVSKRFASSKTLAHVERHLFAKNPVVATARAGDSLEVIEAANIEDEVEQMARRIYKMVSEGTARFNDIGVVLRDITPYYELIEATFSRYGIPARLYVKRPLMESPLIKTVTTLAQIFTSHWEETDLHKVLKSPYINLPSQEVDQLERKALRRGFLAGSDKWIKLAQEGPWPGVKGFFEKLVELEKEIAAPKPAYAFRQWFLRLVGECITLPGATDPSYEDLVKREAQALRSFLSVLDLMARMLGEKPIAFNNFMVELSYTLSASSYALEDKRHDVVNVIDALEARQWELPVVFVGGLLERQFPKQGRENLFLKDKERRQLNRLTGINLKEILKNTGEEERFLFYIALTRASKRLILSYPATDSRGNPNVPSFFLREVKRLFSSKSFKNVFLQRTPSDLIPAAGNILTQKDLRNFICYHLNTPYRRGSNKETHHILARSAYNDLRRDDPILVEDLKVALGTPEAGDIGAHHKIIKEIIPSYRATQLRDYAQCPFLHFSRHILRLEALKSLAEEGLNPVRQGEIIHETLMRYYKGKDKDIAGTFKDVFTSKTRGIRIGLNELRVKEEMLRALRALVEKDKYYETLLPLRPRYFEESFGGDGRPALEIHDSELGTIKISGRIDRVDVAEVDGECIGLVLDYKYSKGGLNGSKIFGEIVEEGVDLQLPIYLMAARECLKVRPIGAQLYPLKPPERSGILEARVKLLATLLPTRGSFFMEEKDMETLLERSRAHILRHVSGIVSGNKDVSPRDIQMCGEGKCEFLDVCRFEKWSGGKKGK
ncbi:MAG: PD-(D/E)XK nuclease family protein [Candidatus Brocadiales bacterium]